MNPLEIYESLEIHESFEILVSFGIHESLYIHESLRFINLINRDSDLLNHFKDSFRFMNFNQIYQTLVKSDVSEELDMTILLASVIMRNESELLFCCNYSGAPVIRAHRDLTSSGYANNTDNESKNIFKHKFLTFV